MSVRICAYPGCKTRLSKYNTGDLCSVCERKDPPRFAGHEWTGYSTEEARTFSKAVAEGKITPPPATSTPVRKKGRSHFTDDELERVLSRARRVLVP